MSHAVLFSFDQNVVRASFPLFPRLKHKTFKLPDQWVGEHRGHVTRLSEQTRPQSRRVAAVDLHLLFSSLSVFLSLLKLLSTSKLRKDGVSRCALLFTALDTSQSCRTPFLSQTIRQTCLPLLQRGVHRYRLSQRRLLRNQMAALALRLAVLLEVSWEA